MLLRAGNVMSIWGGGVRRPRAPTAQAHERGRFGENSGSCCRDVVPLALGNSQDLGGWRAARCPSEVIRYASELLVVHVDLLDDAGIYACVKARVSSESRARQTTPPLPILPHLQLDSLDSGSGAVTGVKDIGESGAAGSR